MNRIAELQIVGDKTGVQFSLAVSGSTSTTDKAKVESKSRTYGGNNDHYYYQVLESSKVTSGTDSHVKIEIGTEQMLVDLGISGSNSEEIDQEYIYRADLPMNEFTLSHLAKTVSAYSRDSESHYNVGLILGGDDPGLTSSGGYSTDEEARNEEHWPAGAGIDITKETYHDHGGDVESDEPRRHRMTQQHSGANGVQIDVIFDNPVTTSSMTPPRSLDDILNEYRDRQTQRDRLQAQLDETTDPDMRQFLQDQINVQTNILADITTAALAAGATQAQLNQITSEAQQAAENDPIDPEEGDGGDSVLLAAILGFKEGEAQGWLNSFNGVQDIVIGMSNFGAQTSPAGIIGSLFGFDPINFESPDWSNGVITTEDPTLHEWSKWLGGNGIVSLASMFPFLPKGFKSGDFVKVDIRSLQYPVQRPFADLAKLAKQGPFDITKYTPPPVFLQRNGVMVLQNGVTRIENARRAGVFELIVQIFTR